MGKSGWFRKPSFLCFLSVFLLLPPAEILDLTSQCKCSASLSASAGEDHRCHRTHHRAESSVYSTEIHSRAPPVTRNSMHDSFLTCTHQTQVQLHDIVLQLWVTPTQLLHSQANSSTDIHGAATSHCTMPTDAAMMSLCRDRQKPGDSEDAQ